MRVWPLDGPVPTYIWAALAGFSELAKRKEEPEEEEKDMKLGGNAEGM